MSGVTNQGVVGYIANPVASFPANSITIDIFGNTFYRKYAFGAGDDTGVYWNDKVLYTERQMLYIAATIGKTLKGKFNYGHKLRSSQSLGLKILLPQTATGKIDFVFMEDYVRELEKLHLHELEKSQMCKIKAYLLTTGLTDHTLSSAEQDALNQLPNLMWQLFNVQELFGKSTRGKRLKSDDRISGSLPFVTAGEVNTGISAFIDNKVDVFQHNTITIDMFGSAKYRNYEYGADDHVAVVHTENLSKYAAIFVTTACHNAAHTGKFNYGHNFYAKDADELNIMLPVKNGSPDVEFMKTLISAVHKLVIKDVVLYADSRIAAARKIINN